MTGTPQTRTLLSIGLGLMLAAAITLFTFLVFEDIAVAESAPAAQTAVPEAYK
ncbi:MAG TPA: hypothetical protein VLT59_03260 [Steroidobacteraceae bacterium]|nr:hypothetical protein [Steroidobacteraceae bacterium]